MANTAKAFLRTAHLVWSRARAADARKTQSEAIREAIPYFLAPVALFGVFEYLTPFVERTETAWKVELANRRAMRLHDEVHNIKAHIGSDSASEPAVGSSIPAQLQALQLQLQQLAEQVHKLQQKQLEAETKNKN